MEHPPTTPTRSNINSSLPVSHNETDVYVDSSFCYLNIQGLLSENNKSKIGYLSELIKDKLLLICTESHLNPSILDEEIQIENFNSYRCDRKSRKCGGIVIYSHNCLNINDSTIVTFSNSVCELLIIKIENMNLHIVCIYRPPDTTSAEFQPCLDKIRTYLKLYLE